MDVTLHMPHDLARRLGKHGKLPRRALEAFALDEFRAGHLTRPELRRLLGFETRDQPDTFLKGCGFDESRTAAGLERDRQDLDQLGV